MWKLLSNKRTENNINITTKEIELRDESMLDRIDEKFREQKQDFEKISDDLLKAINTHSQDIKANSINIGKLETAIEYIKEEKK